MTRPSPSLSEAYERWRTDNPIPFPSAVRAPDGYRRCRNERCPVFIAVDREREYCFGCGGRPNSIGPTISNTEWEVYRRSRKAVTNYRTGHRKILADAMSARREQLLRGVQ